jgi:hypothetical protein
MANMIFISGNDGSGKSTFTRRFRGKANALGIETLEMRYYGFFVRRCLRGVLERVSNASSRKRASDSPAPPGAEKATPPARATGSRGSGGLRGIAILAFLWLYQGAMAIECRIRSALAGSRLQLLDRCFVDDLVSICATLRVAPSPRLIRFSRLAFPHKRLYYLCGGEEVEFARILDMDLSADFHRKKHAIYRDIIDALEPIDPSLRRFSTAPTDGSRTGR